MSIDSQAFLSLFDTLRQIDLFGQAGKNPPSFSEAGKLVSEGAIHIPPVLNTAYSDPLSQHLRRVRSLLGGDQITLETILGSVYQHDPTLASVSPEALNRFLAVISDLYRSFLSKQKRAAANFPLLETLPPLAVFQHDGSHAPSPSRAMT